jgi:hypothetical protein
MPPANVNVHLLDVDVVVSHVVANAVVFAVAVADVVR